MSTSRPICTGFEGNPDIYGLGIRTGVYLQWFSSWLCMTLNPESAHELHAANSIFIFAIITAALVAATSSGDPFRQVEAYILVQICFGYLLTVLSVLGLRLQCMTPARMAQLLAQLSKVPKNISSAIKASFQRNSSQDPTAPRNTSVREAFKMALLGSLAQTPEDLAKLAAYQKLDSIGFLKSGNLTWAGVQWRLVIACLVASFNVWLWFSGINRLDTEHDCDSFIFMFGKERLRGGILTLLRAGAVIYLVVIGLIFLIFSSIGVQVVAYLVRSLVQRILFSNLERRGLLEIVQRKMRQIGELWSRIRQDRWVDIIIQTNTYLRIIDQTWAALLHFITADEKQVPMPSDLLQAYAILSSQRADREQDHQSHQAQQTPPLRSLHVFLSLFSHVWTGACIVWFILCVELTIAWNEISGVHTIRTTSQLIPFTIGIVTSLRAAHQVLLFFIKRKYPSYKDRAIDVSYSWVYNDIRIQIQTAATDLNAPTIPAPNPVVTL